MVEDQPKPRIRPRRIIERPRLIHALDEPNARIKLLVADPGYGKTVLLEQWASRPGRDVGWFRASRSSADVAVVVRSLVAASAELAPNAGSRLLERLSVTENPDREATLLAEMLAEDLTDWPASGWLVIDNYEHIASSPASETFMATLLSASPVRVSIGSTTKPSWYYTAAAWKGGISEIPQLALSMNSSEIAAIRGEPAPIHEDAANANGWPALVGLASMLPDQQSFGAAGPGTQYELCAERVLEALSSEDITGLAALASLPLVDRDIAASALGRPTGRDVCNRAVELGLLDERDGRLEFHTLLQLHLERSHGERSKERLSVAMPQVLALYRHRRDWDAAFELVRRHDLDDELADLLLEAVDDIVFNGRLSTLQSWVRSAQQSGSRRLPVWAIAEIELDLRQGRIASALTSARSLIEVGGISGDVEYRVLMVAARAAHGASRDDEALEYYRQARAAARSVSMEREARWGELMCTSALERSEAHALLDEMVSSVVTSDAKDQVRMADKQLVVGFRFGFVHHLSDSRHVAELVDQVDDPFVRCSFLSVHGWALALGAYYEEAMATSEQLLEETIALRVDPVLPYAHGLQAIALAGLGLHDDARLAVDLAEQSARRINDENGAQNAYAIRMRVLLQDGAAMEACATEPPDTGMALASMKGEVLGSRALALATIGRINEAEDLGREASNLTRGIETQALCVAVSAVCALKQRSDGVVERCDALIEHVFARGSGDIAVTAYRSNPELLATLMASGRLRDQVAYLLKRAGDEERAEALGASPVAFVDPKNSLSVREKEVYDLVCEGLSNAQIARQLYISQSTVKVHVHHVFDKLGIRSRTALALNAARGRYATSTAASVVGSGGIAEDTIPNPSPRANL